MSAAVELLLTYRFVAGVDRGSGGPKPYPLAGPVYPGGRCRRPQLVPAPVCNSSALLPSCERSTIFPRAS